MLDSEQPVRGIATSGWRGRSFSLGIADAVTVLADRAAVADAAATIIANAVDLPGHPEVTRIPARDLAPDTDLGERLVTQDVGELSPDEIAAALDAGAAVVRSLLPEGLIRSAALHLRGITRVVPITSLGDAGGYCLNQSLVVGRWPLAKTKELLTDKDVVVLGS